MSGARGTNGVRPYFRGLTPFGVLLLTLLTGCTDWSDAQRAQTGTYTVLLRAAPEVGSTATVSVGIRDADDRTMRGCNVKFRQYMPEHEMATDDVIVQMTEQRAGVYTGVSPEYSMGGDWRIEVGFDCGSGPEQAHFDIHLDWPE